MLVFLCISEEGVGQCKLWPRGTYWISPSDAARHFGFMDFWHFRPNNGFLPHLSQNPDHWDKKLIDPHLVFDQWEPSLTWRDLSKIAACGSQRHVWHGKPIKPREITSHDTPSQSNQGRAVNNWLIDYSCKFKTDKNLIDYINQSVAFKGMCSILYRHNHNTL